MNKVIKTTNLIKHPAICCVYCGKSYKTRLNLDKHLVLCEITYKSKKTKHSKDDSSYYNEHDENDEDVPSQKILYKIILELSLKCNKLETKVNEMSKYITKKKQKINILDYLNSETYNSNNKPMLLFENITELICVEQSDIEMLFHNGFIQTMNHILSKIIYNNTDDNSKILPVVAFTQKINTIYIYTNATTTNDINDPKLSWVIVTKDKFVRFLNMIQFKMSKALSEWRKKNAQLLNENDSQSILYDKTFSKLMEPDFKTDATYNKYYNNIYNKIKTELKIVEYNLDF